MDFESILETFLSKSTEPAENDQFFMVSRFMNSFESFGEFRFTFFLKVGSSTHVKADFLKNQISGKCFELQLHSMF